MTVLREHLRTSLAQKVDRHGVVIWDDPDAAYADVFTDVVPESASVHSFSGSWFELRKEIEPRLAGQHAPAVVVYIPQERPDSDPLEELRAVGTQFTIKLSTLLKQALKGQLADERIETLGKQCSTITEAEAALEGGEASVDARLISLIGDTSATTIAAQLLSGAHDGALEDRALAEAARSTLAASLGGSYDDVSADALRATVFRQIVLAQLHVALGELPDELSHTHVRPTAARTRTGRSAVQAMRSDTSARAAYVDLADRADQDLHLAALVEWDDALSSVDVTAGIEAIALHEGIRRLENGDFASAAALASERIACSWWVGAESPASAIHRPRWRAIASIAELSDAIDRGIPPMATIAEISAWYTSEGWRVDSAFRQSELARVTSGDALDDLDDLFRQARARYETWLDEVLQTTSAALSAGDVIGVELQRSIHETYVRKQSGRRAYLLVDALRYELGKDLAFRLENSGINAEITTKSAIATPPSITPVGMAALLPGADDDFAIELGADNRLAVSIGGDPVRSVADRVSSLEHAHGKVTDLRLDDVANHDNKQLKKAIDGADLVLVRSTELDGAGEADQLAVTWGAFDQILSVLQTAVAKLLHAGIDQVVITADHGFLAVRQLGSERRIDKPAAESGELHRRAWIGRGGNATPSTIKVPLANFGIRSDLDIIASRGLGVFSSGGGLQFFHGGLSPQELVIPVITVTSQQAAPEPKYTVTIAVAGDRISTGVVAVTLTMEGDLFTRESRVRMQLVHDGERVAGVVGGDGVDTTTDTIEATVDTPRVVNLLVTKNLVAGTSVTLEVLDAATGVRLHGHDVDVAANVIVDDDLD